MIIYLSLVCLLVGRTLVFYSLSPYYSALGLVVVSISGCISLSLIGGSFIALVLLLVYMGGMLVVFAYSSAISAERFPSVRNIREVIGLSAFFSSWVFLSFDNLNETRKCSSTIIRNEGVLGRRIFYKDGRVLVVLGVFILFIVLVGALIISRGAENKIVQAI